MSPVCRIHWPTWLESKHLLVTIIRRVWNWAKNWKNYLVNWTARVAWIWWQWGHDILDCILAYPLVIFKLVFWFPQISRRIISTKICLFFGSCNSLANIHLILFAFGIVCGTTSSSMRSWSLPSFTRLLSWWSSTHFLRLWCTFLFGSVPFCLIDGGLKQIIRTCMLLVISILWKTIFASCFIEVYLVSRVMWDGGTVLLWF